MEKSAIVLGVDESEHSLYALEWTLSHLFFPDPANCPFKLVILHAKTPAIAAASVAGPGTADVPLIIDEGMKKIAGSVLEKAKVLCHAKLVNDVIFEVSDGDARSVLCEAVEKHNASILVVGSHGYGAMKRAILGSVSDYCAHRAHCAVMIVKTPTTKH